MFERFLKWPNLHLLSVRDQPKMPQHSIYSAMSDLDGDESISKTARDDVSGKKEEDIPKAELGRWDSRRWAALALNILLSIIPLYFIGMICRLSLARAFLSFLLGLAIIAFCLHGRLVRPFGMGIERVNRFSPTIFPIVFAAILGRLLKVIGRWLAECGSRLSVGHPGCL